MLNSTKSILFTIIFLVAGISTIIFFVSSYGRSFIDEDLWISLIIVAALFICCGYFHGTARGWYDIELRRRHPDFFKGENVEDD